MNCKQGDMAVIVRSAANNEGRTVTCLEYVGLAGVIQTERGALFMTGDDYWRVDVKLNTMNNKVGIMNDCVHYVRDSCLMPISGYKEPMQSKKEERISQ